MGRRRKNEVQTTSESNVESDKALSLAEAKTLFLRELRGLVKQTRRWHRENVTALEKVPAKQNIVVKDVTVLTRQRV